MNAHPRPNGTPSRNNLRRGGLIGRLVERWNLRKVERPKRKAIDTVEGSIEKRGIVRLKEEWLEGLSEGQITRAVGIAADFSACLACTLSGRELAFPKQGNASLGFAISCEGKHGRVELRQPAKKAKLIHPSLENEAQIAEFLERFFGALLNTIINMIAQGNSDFIGIEILEPKGEKPFMVVGFKGIGKKPVFDVDADYLVDRRKRSGLEFPEEFEGPSG